MKNLFEVSSLEAAGGALAAAHGFEYDLDFANAVRRLQEWISPGDTGHRQVIVVLGYGPYITLTSLVGSAVYGTFLVCDESLAGNITRRMLRPLPLPSLTARTRTFWLIRENPWRSFCRWITRCTGRARRLISGPPASLPPRISWKRSAAAKSIIIQFGGGMTYAIRIF